MNAQRITLAGWATSNGTTAGNLEVEDLNSLQGEPIMEHISNIGDGSVGKASRKRGGMMPDGGDLPRHTPPTYTQTCYQFKTRIWLLSLLRP
jgi:hypothetical protein